MQIRIEVGLLGTCIYVCVYMQSESVKNANKINPSTEKNILSSIIRNIKIKFKRGDNNNSKMKNKTIRTKYAAMIRESYTYKLQGKKNTKTY